MVRNHEVHCNPIPAADVPGFRFTRNQNGVIVARCTACRIGFVVREENAERVRFAMGAHQEWVHGSHLSRAALGLDNSREAVGPVIAVASEAADA